MANINIFGTLHNVTGEPLVKAAEIKDDALNKTQAEINQMATAGGFETVDVGSNDLPTADASTVNKLYLKNSSDPDTNNVKEEWITVTYRVVTYNNKEYKITNKGTADGWWSDAAPTGTDGEIRLHDDTNDFTYASWDNNGVAHDQDLVEEWSDELGYWNAIDLRLGDSYIVSGGSTVVATASGWSDIEQVPMAYAWELIGGNQIQSDWNQTDNSAKDFIKNKPEVQTKLVSGTNIKTINNQSLVDITSTTNIAVQPVCYFGEISASDSPLLTKPNRYFKLTGQVGTLQIVLREPTVDATYIGETYVYFTTGSNPNITYISQSGLPILADTRFQIIPNTTYELKFTYNGTSWTVSQLELTNTLYINQI